MSEIREALRVAADAARFAPSIHNTQPWRFVVAADRLEVWADRSRQLTALDPDGHMLLISCGAALHDVGVALAAEGWRFDIERPAGEPLAVVRPTARSDAPPEAMQRFQAALVRRTDRRVVTTEPVSAAAVAAVEHAARIAGARLYVVPEDQRVELAAAVDQAQRIQDANPAQRTELGRWVGGSREDGSGLPDAVIPAEPPETTVPERNFGRAGSLAPGSGHDSAAVYAILYGDGDRPIDWLRAGEALNAAWLAATTHGVALLPYSAPTEVPATRETLRRILAGVGYPYIALRLGIADPDHAEPPSTPRRTANETIEEIR